MKHESTNSEEQDLPIRQIADQVNKGMFKYHMTL